MEVGWAGTGGQVPPKAYSNVIFKPKGSITLHREIEHGTLRT